MEDIGEKMWMLLMVYLYSNNIVFNNFDELISILENIQVKGIGDITKFRMINGLKRNLNQIKECLQYIKFVDYTAIINKGNNNGTITLSGTRDKQLSDYLSNKGYDVNSSITKNTKALVIPDSNFTSSKVAKALQMNIPVYTIEEAYDKF